MKNVKKMEMNQFKFGRFWQLIYAKITENMRNVGIFTIMLTLVIIAYKIGKVLFSSDSLTDSLADVAYTGDTWVGILYVTLVFKFVVGDSDRQFFMLPVTNLERYIAMHLLPILSVAFMWIVCLICSEALWRLGLWLITPDVYAQYMEVLPDLRRVNPVKVMFLFVMILYFEYALFSSMAEKFGCLVQLILILLIPALLIFIVIKVADFLPLNNSVFFSIVIVLVMMVLLVASYRGFCRYEPNLKKTSTE